VHALLVFDIVDRWKDRSIGRCTYQVGPPAGRTYTARPFNAGEAAERRLERFQNSHAPPGSMTMPDETNPIFPMTLDLRLPPGQKAHIDKPGLAQ
jgi:uncharacterized protein (DUF2126 family)